MEGHKDPVTHLWILPISTNANDIYETEKYKHIKPSLVQHHPNFAGSITFIKTKSGLIQYYHQCTFIPIRYTLIQVIKRHDFSKWPGLTLKSVQKHLPAAISINK